MSAITTEKGVLLRYGAEAFDASTHQHYALLWRMNVSSAYSSC